MNWLYGACAVVSTVMLVLIAGHLYTLSQAVAGLIGAMAQQYEQAVEEIAGRQ